MIKIKVFSFNSFQVNTYLLYDENGDCAIIDPACYSKIEKDALEFFISENHLIPKICLNTHCHIDHILGNNFVFEKYGLKPVTHADGVGFLKVAPGYGETFGFAVEEQILPDQFLTAEDTIRLGEHKIYVLETPGHAAGSLCFYHPKDKFVIVGDVLFHQSIGRTDLPTGNFDTLMKSIREELFVLPDETTVYPGHGPSTTIGFEKQNNPFL